MKRGLLVGSFVLFSLLIVLGFVIASYDYKDQNIDRNYNGGEIIRGKFNISFTNQEAKSLFTSNVNNNITLIDLLERNEFTLNSDYNCTTSNCMDGFTAKNIINEVNGDQYIGFKLTGANINEVSFANINLASDSAPSCSSNVKIDFFANGSYLVNDKYIDEPCGTRNYGCFQSSLSNEYATLSVEPYCEKITLPAGPAYRIGAKVRNSTNGKSNIIMELIDPADTNSVLAGCLLPNLTQNEQDLDCVAKYASGKSKTYLVCIRTDDYTDYKVKTESGSTICGTDNRGSSYDLDYEIYGIALKNDKFNITINDSSYEKYTGEILTSKILDYVDDKYDGNCVSGCIIPIKVSGDSRVVKVSSPRISYKSGNTGKTAEQVYNISIEPAKISSKYLNIVISKAGFTIPIDSTGKKFTLYLDGNKVFESAINITKGFDFDISSKFVSYGRETLFSANIANVSSTWDFGDGTSVVNSANNGANHKYMEEGNFTIRVELIKTNGQKSSKSFIVKVGGIKRAIDSTLVEYSKRVGNLTKQINGFSDSEKKEIVKTINLTIMNETLNSIKGEYTNATEEDYSDIYDQIAALDVPYLIYSSESGNGLSLLIGINEIDTSYIKEISNNDVEKDLILEISTWMIDNYDAVVDFKVVSASRDSGLDNLYTKFTIKLNLKKETDDSYLIIGYPRNAIQFAQNYEEKDIGSGTYIPISGSKTVEFILPEKVELAGLGAYVSPDVSKLNVIENVEPVNKENPRWKTAWWIILLVAFIVLIVYIILQEWYKRYYESHLFKDKDHLYNMVMFIHNARLSGLRDSDIRKKLQGSGWTGEQITYAFGKIDGKRTGMWEIPLFKWVENRKVKEEIAKRGRKVY